MLTNGALPKRQVQEVPYPLQVSKVPGKNNYLWTSHRKNGVVRTHKANYAVIVIVIVAVAVIVIVAVIIDVVGVGVGVTGVVVGRGRRCRYGPRSTTDLVGYRRRLSATWSEKRACGVPR